MSTPASEPASEPGDRILEAAREVFAADGLDAHLGTIAARAGVGVGSIYRWFGNKNDLIQEVAAVHFETILSRMAAAATADDPWEAFSLEFRNSVAEYASDRGFRELVLGSVTGSFGWARGSRPEKLELAMRQWSAQMESVIERLIGRARAAGELRADATGSIILRLSLALQSVAGFGDAEEQERTISIVLDGLRPR
ncbi:MAG TPA: TetR/AcrR family transcriptional regulator [Galbitalea sp.]|nr:TetR/AcrR family transcriptional regulator [Galbitalea sp.]